MKEGIDLNFNVDLDQKALSSYRDIVYNKNQLEYIQNEVRALEKEYNDKKASKTADNMDSYLDNVKEINGINTIIMSVNNLDMNDLKVMVDELINRMGTGVVFLVNEKENGVNFICKCNNDKVNAGLLVKKAATLLGGRGGGSATFAQGGVNTSCDIEDILKSISDEIEDNS